MLPSWVAEIGSPTCRALCYYLYLKRYGLQDHGEQKLLWDCLIALGLDKQESGKSLSFLFKSLRTTLAKAHDKFNDIGGIITYANSAGCLDAVECGTLQQALLDLLRVSATFYVQVALHFDTAENLAILQTLPKLFPQKGDLTMASPTHPWMSEFSQIPFVEVEHTLNTDPRRLKLYQEAIGIEATLVKAMQEFYSIQAPTPRMVNVIETVKTQGFPSSAEPRAAIRWDLNATLEESERREMFRIRDDLKLVQSLQESLSTEVSKAANPLDQTESAVGATQMTTRQSNMALVQSAKDASKTWTFEGGAFGAVCGGIAGLLAGPAGAVVGLAAGGAFGTWTGKALKDRRASQLSEIEKQLEQPQRTRADTNCLLAVEGQQPSRPPEEVKPPLQRGVVGCSTLPVSFYRPLPR